MGKQFRPGWIGSLTESEQAIGVCPFSHCRRACCVTAVPPSSQISICATPWHTGPRPRNKPQRHPARGRLMFHKSQATIVSHNLQFSLLVSFLLVTKNMAMCRETPCLYSSLFMDLQPFSPVLLRRAPTIT